MRDVQKEIFFSVLYLKGELFPGGNIGQQKFALKGELVHIINIVHYENYLQFMFHHHLVLSQTLTEKPTSSDYSQARQAQLRRAVYNCLAVRNIHVTKQTNKHRIVMFNTCITL